MLIPDPDKPGSVIDTEAKKVEKKAVEVSPAVEDKAKAEGKPYVKQSRRRGGKS